MIYKDFMEKDPLERFIAFEEFIHAYMKANGILWGGGAIFDHPYQRIVKEENIPLWVNELTEDQKLLISLLIYIGQIGDTYAGGCVIVHSCKYCHALNGTHSRLCGCPKPYDYANYADYIHALKRGE